MSKKVITEIKEATPVIVNKEAFKSNFLYFLEIK